MIFQEEMCVDYRFEVPREKGEENTSMYIHPRIEIRLWSHFDHTQMENNYTSARIQLDDVVCMNLYTSIFYVYMLPSKILNLLWPPFEDPINCKHIFRCVCLRPLRS